MRRLMAVLALGLALVVPTTAQACQTPAPRDLQRATQADVVVVGRISRYRLVRDEAGRRMNREMLAHDPELAKAIGEPPDSLMTDYALFEVRVTETLSGRAPRRLRVRLDSAGPRPPGSGTPYLIVLEASKPGAPAVFTVLNQTCSGAFLFPEGEPDALTVRRLLAGEPPSTPEGRERRAEPAVPTAPMEAPTASAVQMDWSETPGLYRILLGAAVAGLLIALSAVAWRRRRAPGTEGGETVAATGSETERRVVALIAHVTGLPEDRITPGRRMSEDLGVDGDDAVELFEAFGQEFGADLEPLYARWNAHFGPEGWSLADMGQALAGVVGLGAPAAVLGAMAGLPEWLCIPLGLIVWAIWLFPLQAWPFPRKDYRPVFVHELIKAAETGRWPDRPEQVRPTP